MLRNLVVSLLCVFIFTATVSGEIVNVDGMEKVAENRILELYADFSSGDVAVVQKSNERTWWAVPSGRENDRVARGVYRMNISSQLLVSYVNMERNQTYARNTFAGSVQRGDFTITEIPNGIRIDYEFSNEGLLIPLILTLSHDYLKVEIPLEEIRESDVNKILSLGVLPYFGAGSTEETGYIFVPDGSGALINFNNGKEKMAAYRERIYGRDHNFAVSRRNVVTQQISLPVYGISKGDSGFLAVITEGDSLGSINASVSGSTSSFNHVYPEFTIRASDQYSFNDERAMTAYEQELVKSGRIAIRYYFLDETSADYSGMARRYRQHLQDYYGIEPLVSETTPLYVDLYGAVMRKKSFLGFPKYRVESLTTFGQVAEIIDYLQANGIEDLVLQLRNWSKEALIKQIPGKISPLRHLGGKADFNKLLRSLADNAVDLSLELNFIEFARSGNGFSKVFDSVRNLSRGPTLIREHLLSTYFPNPEKKSWRLLHPQQVNKAVEKFLHSYSESFPALSPNTLGNMLYSDFSKIKVTREETKKLWQAILTNLSRNKSIMLEKPHAYALPYTKHAVGIPLDSSHFDLCDVSIPFYQMAISGLISYTTSPINLSADPELLFLRAIETGSLPHFAWIYEDPSVLKETTLDNLYSGDFRVWTEMAAKHYREVQQLKQLTGQSAIFSHQTLFPNVVCTEYENGVKVIVNFNDYEVELEEQLLASRSYLILGEGH